MALYNKTTWISRVREYANRITLGLVSGNTYDVIQVEGDIDTIGTPFSTTAMQNIEDQVEYLTNEHDIATYSDITKIQNAIMSSFPPGTLRAKLLAQISGLTVAYQIYTEDVADAGTTSFSSILSGKYYDKLNNVIITGTGSSITITNSIGATSDMAVVYMDLFDIETNTASEMADITAQMSSGTSLQHAIANIKCVGKNLLSEFNFEQGGLDVSTGAENTSLARIRSGYISADANTYTLKILTNDTIASMDLFTFDSNKNFISRVAWSPSVVSNTLLVNGYLRATFRTDSGLTPDGTIGQEAQIEIGTTATPYTPYQENLFQPNITLRSLPNGVQDKLYNSVVDPDDSSKLLALDGWVHEKNVSDGVAVVGVVAINTTNYSLAKDTGYFYNDITGGIVESGIIGTDSTTATGTLYYELATPVITQLSLDEIYSFEDGTLYQEQIPCEIDYTSAINSGALIDGLTQSVESLDDARPVKIYGLKILTTDWVDDTSNAERPFWYVQIVLDIGTDDIPSFAVDPLDKLNGYSGELTNDIESFDGYVRIYALSQPTNSFSMDILGVK